MSVTDAETRYTDDIPLEAQGNYVHDIHVQRDQQTSRALIPPKHDPFQLQAKQTTSGKSTYHNAVAVKHNVLPTYMGSLNTLKGNPSTR